jgi:hypothetical protein
MISHLLHIGVLGVEFLFYSPAIACHRAVVLLLFAIAGLEAAVPLRPKSIDNGITLVIVVAIVILLGLVASASASEERGVRSAPNPQLKDSIDAAGDGG